MDIINQNERVPIIIEFEVLKYVAFRNKMWVTKTVLM